MWTAVLTALAVAGALVWWATREAAPPSIAPIDPEPARPGWKGTLRDPAAPLVSEADILCYDPATGYVLGRVPADTATSISDKIARAQAAQRAWRTSSFAQRRRVLRTMMAWIQRDMEGIARIACRDTGKTVRCAPHTGHRCRLR